MKKKNLQRFLLTAFAVATMMFGAPGMEAKAEETTEESADGEVVEETFDFENYVGKVRISGGYAEVKNATIDRAKYPEFAEYTGQAFVYMTDDEGIVLDKEVFWMADGKWDKAFCGLVDEGIARYFKDGKQDKTLNGLVEVNGRWIYWTEGERDVKVDGLILYDGEWFYMEMGEIDTEFNGLVKYDGSWFWVAAGRVCTEASGPVQTDKYFKVMDGEVYSVRDLKEGESGSWMYLADGMVQTQYMGLADYDGEWFYMEGGKIVNGVDVDRKMPLVVYNGAAFYVSTDGHIPLDYTGLVDVSYRSGLIDYTNWVYLVSGQITDYSGMIEFDGSLFYLEDGVVQCYYTGWVEFGGQNYYVVNGQVTNETENLPAENKIGSYLCYFYGYSKNDGSLLETGVAVAEYDGYYYQDENGNIEYEWGKALSDTLLHRIDRSDCNLRYGYGYAYDTKQEGHTLHFYEKCKYR